MDTTDTNLSGNNFDASSPADLVNIGPTERNKRRIFGLIMMGVALVMLTSFIRAEVSIWWRATLWLPLFLGSIGILQCYHFT